MIVVSNANFEYRQTAGTNRNGQTFLDALLQVIGWTPLDFDTVFSLWLEQCRQGKRATS